MSLIITGNKLVANTTGAVNEGIEQNPYQYRNFLKETITLQPNSEVAVQSVKINKSNSIKVVGDDGFYMMWNKDIIGLDDGTTSADTTGYEVWCPFLEGGELSKSYSLGQFREAVSSALKKGVPHPDLYNIKTSNPNFNLPLASDRYDSSSGKFLGFDLSMVERDTNEDLNIVSEWDLVDVFKWYYDDDPLDIEFSKETKNSISVARFTAEKDAVTNPIIDNDCVITHSPITQLGGNLRFDLDGVVEDETDWHINTEFGVGLCRAKPQDASFYPFGINFDNGGNLPKESVAIDPNDTYCDFMIRSIKNGSNFELVLCQASTNPLDTDEVVMREIDYYSFAKSGSVSDPKLSDGSGGRYLLNTNDEKIKQFLIRVENEVVKFYFNKYAGLDTGNNPLDWGYWELFCSYDLYNWSGGDSAVNYKPHYPKPINQGCWSMYPRVYVRKMASTDDDRYVDISCWSGVETNDKQSIPSPYLNPNNDWSARMLRANEPAPIEEIEQRFFNNQSNTQKYSYQTLTSGKQFKEQIFALILQKDQKHYVHTTNIMRDDFIGRKMGFENIPILRPTINGSAGTYDNGIGWIYKSTDTPLMVNSGSHFVRLDNYTQKTLNGLVGRPSKILYTIPSFDNAGQNSGLLFYEPADRVYVKLHNPQPLTINTFDISICDENEVLSQELLDQSLVTLHFRDTPTMN